jgi:hypothetical protein
MSLEQIFNYEISWDIPSEVLMLPYVSFISVPGCLAAAAGLVTPLRTNRTCLVDRVAPLGLRYGQALKVRPPAPKLPQPWVDLIQVTPPTAIHLRLRQPFRTGTCCSEVSQLVGYDGSSVALQEQGKEWHPAKHKIAGANVHDRGGGGGSYSG